MDLIERLTKEVERIEDEAGSGLNEPVDNARHLLGIVTDELEDAAAIGKVSSQHHFLDVPPTLSEAIAWLRSTDRWTV